METSTIIDLFSDKQFIVSKFKNGYTWETNFAPKDSIVFLENIVDNLRCIPIIPYDFGTFIFKEDNGKHIIIDGKQRITAISILVSVLLLKLHSIRKLSLNEKEIYETMIKRETIYKLKINGLENQLFKDYVVDQISVCKNNFLTQLAKNIVNTFDYFTEEIAEKEEVCLLKLLCCISNAKCKYKIIKENNIFEKY